MSSGWQTDQPHLLVEVPIGVARRPIAANLVLLAQPPAEPLFGMGVDRPISWTHWTQAEVIRPASQFAVQTSHDKLDIQEGSATVSFLGETFHHAFDVSAPTRNRFKSADLKLVRPRGLQRCGIDAKRKPPATISRRRRKWRDETDQLSA
jgi:hypothetical protein